MDECADAVVQSPEDALSFPFLRRSIRTGEPKGNAMCGKVRTQCIVVKLLSVVRLEGKQW